MDSLVHTYVFIFAIFANKTNIRIIASCCPRALRWSAILFACKIDGCTSLVLRNSMNHFGKLSVSGELYNYSQPQLRTSIITALQQNQPPHRLSVH